MQPHERKDALRIYLLRSKAPSEEPGAWRIVNMQKTWRPLSNDRCISTEDLGHGIQMVRQIVGNYWDTNPIWRNFNGSQRTVVRDYAMPPAGTAIYVNRSFAPGTAVTYRTPPADCVCVCIAFYPDPDWEKTECFNPDLSPALIRDIRLFTGNDGKPDGPVFGDLLPQDDADLADGSLIRMAVLSTIG